MRWVRIVGTLGTLVLVLASIAQIRGWGTPIWSIGQLPNYLDREYLYGLCIGERSILFAEVFLWLMWIPPVWAFIEVVRWALRWLNKAKPTHVGERGQQASS